MGVGLIGYSNLSKRLEYVLFRLIPSYSVLFRLIRSINFSNPADKAAHDRMTGMVEAMLELQGQKAAQKAAQKVTASGNALAALEARITQLDASIDALVYELYGLTEEEIAVVEAAVAG